MHVGISATSEKQESLKHAAMLHLLVSQDDHRQTRLHLQEALQLGLRQREALPVRGVHHVHQNVSPSQVVQPVAPQVLATTNCSARNTPQQTLFLQMLLEVLKDVHVSLLNVSALNNPAKT